eukprot:4971217-Pleurochrysis_carterae.AAC.2
MTRGITSRAIRFAPTSSILYTSSELRSHSQLPVLRRSLASQVVACTLRLHVWENGRKRYSARCSDLIRDGEAWLAGWGFRNTVHACLETRPITWPAGRMRHQLQLMVDNDQHVSQRYQILCTHVLRSSKGVGCDVKHFEPVHGRRH